MMIERMNIKQKIITGMMIILALLLWSNTPAYAQLYPCNQVAPGEDGTLPYECTCGTGAYAETCSAGQICNPYGAQYNKCTSPTAANNQNQAITAGAPALTTDTISSLTAAACPWGQKTDKECKCGSHNTIICRAGQYCMLFPHSCSDVPPCPSGGETAATEQCTCLGQTCSKGQYCSSTKKCVNEATPDPKPRTKIEEDDDESCLPKDYYETYAGCTFCPMFRVVFNAASQMTKLAIDKLAYPIYHLVIFAFALWIALEVLKMVSSPETKDIKDFFAATINKAFVDGCSN